MCSGHTKILALLSTPHIAVDETHFLPRLRCDDCEVGASDGPIGYGWDGNEFQVDDNLYPRSTLNPGRPGYAPTAPAYGQWSSPRNHESISVVAGGGR